MLRKLDSAALLGLLAQRRTQLLFEVGNMGDLLNHGCITLFSLWFGKHDGIQDFLCLLNCICELVPIANDENDEHALPMYIIEQDESPLLRVIDDVLSIFPSRSA